MRHLGFPGHVDSFFIRYCSSQVAEAFSACLETVLLLVFPFLCSDNHRYPFAPAPPTFSRPHMCEKLVWTSHPVHSPAPHNKISYLHSAGVRSPGTTFPPHQRFIGRRSGAPILHVGTLLCKFLYH